MAQTHEVWLGHDNTFDFFVEKPFYGIDRLRAGSTPWDLTAASKIVLQVGGVTVDSTMHTANIVDYTTRATEGVVTFLIGHITGLTEGFYADGHVVVYDTDFPTYGHVVTDSLRIHVKLSPTGDASAYTLTYRWVNAARWDNTMRWGEEFIP